MIPAAMSSLFDRRPPETRSATTKVVTPTTQLALHDAEWTREDELLLQKENRDMMGDKLNGVKNGVHRLDKDGDYDALVFAIGKMDVYLAKGFTTLVGILQSRRDWHAREASKAAGEYLAGGLSDDGDLLVYVRHKSASMAFDVVAHLLYDILNTQHLTSTRLPLAARITALADTAKANEAKLKSAEHENLELRVALWAFAELGVEMGEMGIINCEGKADAVEAATKRALELVPFNPVNDSTEV